MVFEGERTRWLIGRDIYSRHRRPSRLQLAVCVVVLIQGTVSSALGAANVVRKVSGMSTGTVSVQRMVKKEVQQRATMAASASDNGATVPASANGESVSVTGSDGKTVTSTSTDGVTTTMSSSDQPHSATSVNDEETGSNENVTDEAGSAEVSKGPDSSGGEHDFDEEVGSESPPAPSDDNEIENDSTNGGGSVLSTKKGSLNFVLIVGAASAVIVVLILASLLCVWCARIRAARRMPNAALRSGDQDQFVLQEGYREWRDSVPWGHPVIR